MDEEQYRRQVGPIHPQDAMFTGSYQRYFSAGQSAVTAIEWSLAAGGHDWSTVRACLDLPCGYGRVARHLVGRMPAKGVTACDLMTGGVDFCARQFGVRGLYSHADPRRMVFPETYDLIWVGSLFTHLPYARSVELMRVLAGALADNGVLAFSAAGDDCLDRLLAGRGYAANLLANKAHQDKDRVAAAYVTTGWAFVPYAGSDDYGLAFLSTDAVHDLIEDGAAHQVALLGYHRAGWNGDHDIYAVARRANSPVLAARAAAAPGGPARKGAPAA